MVQFTLIIGTWSIFIFSGFGSLWLSPFPCDFYVSDWSPNVYGQDGKGGKEKKEDEGGKEEEAEEEIQWWWGL